MDNQHRKITGYRELTEMEIHLMNEGKELAKKCGAFIEKLEYETDTDKRWVAEGKTDLQKGFMSLIRSVAKPETF